MLPSAGTDEEKDPWCNLKRPISGTAAREIRQKRNPPSGKQPESDNCSKSCRLCRLTCSWRYTMLCSGLLWGTVRKRLCACCSWVIAWHIPLYRIAPTSNVISADLFFKIFTFIRFMKAFYTLQTTCPCVYTLAWKRAEWFSTEIAAQDWLLLKWLIFWLMSFFPSNDPQGQDALADCQWSENNEQKAEWTRIQSTDEVADWSNSLV